MKGIKGLLIGFMLIASNAQASNIDEITHLLTFVEQTSCQYERNGKLHAGAEARKHIQKKYDYYADDIVTAEDFIRYSASKSKMSGKHYLIHCEGKPTVKSQDWLLAELSRFRHS